MADLESQTQSAALRILGRLYAHEVAGIIRYLHYSFLIMGHNRIPIQKWLREQADEGIAHSVLVGEKITSLGGAIPVIVANSGESHARTLDEILAEALEFEEQALKLYRELATEAAATDDIALEELARQQIFSEQDHADAVRKMLRRPA
ncbi:MAG: ferritin-like domain-containing protein [Candidatus Velthaea sp.]|jgi:bacterioferritin